MRSNWQYLLLAVVLALFSWYLVSGRERVEAWVEIPVVTSGAPQGLVVRQGLPSSVEVRVEGPRRLVRGLGSGGEAYILDLSDLEHGENVLILDPADLPLTGPVQVLELVPASVRIAVEALLEREVPVEARFEGPLDSSWELKSTAVEPSRVRVRGPASAVQDMAVVRTLPLSVDRSRPEVVREKVGLDPPAGVEAAPASVEVRLAFGPKTVPVWVKMDVQLPQSLQGRATVEPADVRLQIALPEYLAQDAAFRKDVHVSVPDGNYQPGSHEVLYEVRLPRHTSLIKARPDKVVVTVGEQ